MTFGLPFPISNESIPALVFGVLVLVPSDSQGS
jgi:hypothetical protein